jgi:transposase
MPCKKPLVPKRRHYSRDLKRRVIYQTEVLGMAPTKVAINLNMPIRVVQRVKQTWNEISEVCRDRTAMGRASLMSPEHCKVSYLLFLKSYVSLLIIVYWQFLLALLEHSPDIYLDEIQEQLEEQHNIEVSISTVS